MGLAWRGDFMQRAARQSAAEDVVHGTEAERQNACIAVDSGRFLQRLEALPQFLEHKL